MRKIGYQISLFIITQLAICTAITLWILWYIYEKNTRETFVELAQRAYININYSTEGHGGMVFGILILTFIFISSSLIFIELIKSKTQVKQGLSLSSAFTHELITPLTCINMNLEYLLKMKDVDNDKREHLLKAAFNESKKLQNSIDKILETKRIEFNKSTLVFEDVYVDNFFENYLRNCKEHFPDKNIVLNIDIYSDAIISIDHKYFKIVLDNLIENAIKYSSSNLKIGIDIRQYKNKCIISIKDNGMGLLPKDLRKVFKIFYRTNENIRGNGLGLFIAKNILKLHKAKIKVHSEGKEQGCVFSIALPLKENE